MRPGSESFNETDYARLLDAAHQQLVGLLVVWDNLNVHVSRVMASLRVAGSAAARNRPTRPGRR